MNDFLDIWIGWDSRQPLSYDVFRSSLDRRASRPLRVRPLMLKPLRTEGLYTREHITKDGQAWDTISGAPMSTEFALSRFLVPHLQQMQRATSLYDSPWCLFAECDMLALADIAELFALADDRYAVMCVKHVYRPKGLRKMDAQSQTRYPCKNWSSLMLINANHPANKLLTVAMVNTLPGRDLHSFCWLEHGDIGDLPPEWNYLVGEEGQSAPPKLLHYTIGTHETLIAPWLHECMRLRRPLPPEAAVAQATPDAA